MKVDKQVHNPVVGEVYMARREYNSKRMIMEPFRVIQINMVPSYYNPDVLTPRFAGEWCMDKYPGTVRGKLNQLDEKWVNRKIELLRGEMLATQKHIDNLSRIIS